MVAMLTLFVSAIHDNIFYGDGSGDDDGGCGGGDGNGGPLGGDDYPFGVGQSMVGKSSHEARVYHPE